MPTIIIPFTMSPCQSGPGGETFGTALGSSDIIALYRQPRQVDQKGAPHLLVDMFVGPLRRPISGGLRLIQL